MEIKVRDINPATVKKLDKLAKENNVSRQVYLKTHLEAFAINELHTNIIDRYEKQLETNMMLLEKTNKTLDYVLNVFEDLLSDE